VVPYFGEHVIWLCIQLPYNNKGGVYHWGEGVAAELGLPRPALLSKEYSVSRWCLLLLYQACVCNVGSAPAPGWSTGSVGVVFCVLFIQHGREKSAEIAHPLQVGRRERAGFFVAPHLVHVLLPTPDPNATHDTPTTVAPSRLQRVKTHRHREDLGGDVHAEEACHALVDRHARHQERDALPVCSNTQCHKTTLVQILYVWLWPTIIFRWR
jgi:hypothetical protein